MAEEKNIKTTSNTSHCKARRVGRAFDCVCASIKWIILIFAVISIASAVDPSFSEKFPFVYGIYYMGMSIAEAWLKALVEFTRLCFNNHPIQAFKHFFAFFPEAWKLIEGYFFTIAA